jgi:pyrroloquinoline quinone biosynthesis protein D
MTDAHDVFRKTPGTEATQLGDDLVVLEPGGKVIRGLNATAAKIWYLTDGKRSLSEISVSLAREFSISSEEVLPDVLSFTEELERHGLLERTTPPPSGRSD